MTILKWIVIVIAGFGAAYASAFAFGAWRWTATTRDLVARLDAGRVSPGIARYSPDELAGLPPRCNAISAPC